MKLRLLVLGFATSITAAVSAQQASAPSACAPAAGLTFICGLQNPRRVYAFSRATPGAGPLRFAQLKDFGPDNVRWIADNRGDLDKRRRRTLRSAR